MQVLKHRFLLGLYVAVSADEQYKAAEVARLLSK